MTEMGEQRIPGYCALCISRCGCVSVVEDGVLRRVEPDPAHPTGKRLCIKGKAAPELVHDEGRLLHPLRRTRPKGDPDPGWERISWEEALDATAARMRGVAARHGARAVAFSLATPSGTAIADGVPWIFRLVHAFGSSSTVWTTHICNWHRDFTPLLTFGADTGMPDYERTGCILLWGFNPSECWLSQATAIAEAVKRGAKLVVVDPRRAGLAAKADSWLRVRPGTDGALALSLASVMIDEGWYDRAFIEQWSNGPFLVRGDGERLLTEADLREGGDEQRLVAWDEALGRPAVYEPATGCWIDPPGRAALLGEHEIATREGTLRCRTAFDRYAELCRAHSPERAERITGVPAQEIREAARLLHENGPVSHYVWSGVGQGTNASQTSRAISLLYALTGCFDAPGGNVYFEKPPIRDVSGLDLVTADQRRATLGIGERPLGPASRGWITASELYRAIEAQEPHPVKMLVGFGANLLVSRPGADRGRGALDQLEFHVHADMFLTPTARRADIVLPVASAWERGGLMAGFMVGQRASSHLQLRAPVLPPRGESRSDTWIVFELARRLGLGHLFFDGDMDAALRYVLEPTGITLEELRARPEGISMPLTTRYRKYAEGGRGFATPSRRVEIHSQRLADAGQPPLPAYVEPALSPERRPDLHARHPLVLTSAKSLPFCQSQHRSVPGLRKHMPDPVVDMHPEAARARGIAEGDWVVVRSPRSSMRARARLDPSLRPGVACAQFGFWQSCPGLGLPGHAVEGEDSTSYNGLIDEGERDPLSGSFGLRACLCEIERVEGRA